MKHTYPSKRLLLSTFLMLLLTIGYGNAITFNLSDLTTNNVTVATLPSSSACATNVVINELDADTAGTDTLEFVELYDGGVGNMALDGLVLVFYNGSNNLSYASYDLDGQTTNADGYFVIGNAAVANVSIVIPSNGLQNGADAVALYTADGTDFPNGSAVSLTNLEDALVYDTNDSDDPDLLVLLNAGQSQVNEDGGGDKDAHSSQRIPNGTGGARNTATYAQLLPSPGAVNFDPLSTPVFIINELDADTAGTDTLEFVEIYDGGIGNSALDGLVLVLFNGSNNLSYAAHDLDGQTTNADGYFVIGNAAVANVGIVIPSNGLQNGADAAALYTGDGSDFPNGSAVTTVNLEDALVYDTNDSDDPELLVLLNAGESQVNEDGAGDKDAHSSQRIPNGDGGARNTATYAQLEPTPGAINMAPAPVAEVIINELDADTAGTDTMEFVELYDGGVGNTALDGMVLVFYNGSNNLSYASYDLDGQTTNAQGYFVIGNAAVPNVSVIFSSNGLQNGADAVGLYTGDSTDFPSGTAVTTSNLLDAIVYDTNDSDDPDLLPLLNAGEPQVNEDGAGDKDAHSNQRFANGSGGARNTSTYVQAIPTPGASNTNAVVPVTLIINELDADTAGTDTLEFIELYDGGTGNTSLSGFVIVLYNGNGDTSYNAFDLDGFTTNAEGYFVIGNAAVANVDVVVGSNSFQNGADAAGLYEGDATSFPNGTAVTTAGLVDALVYDTSDADDAGLLILLNAGQGQVDEAGMGNKDGDSNQRIPNGQGGARNTATYTQATPTPGTENGAIIPPPAPISILDARNAALSELVTISGVLTVSDQFSGSAYLQDSTAGIAIFDQIVHGDGLFAIGDSITVTGTRSAFNDQVQISAVSSVENNGLPNVPITPLTITLAELASHPAELVRVAAVTFPTPGDILFGNSNYILTDLSGPGEIRIDNDVAEIVGLGQPETCPEIIGVVGRFFEIFQLLPRSAADMSCAGPYVPPAPPIVVPKEQTLDVVTWNIEWFGDESNSPPAGDPNSDAIQKDAAKAIIMELNADIYAVQEISDDVLFEAMVNELPGYDFVLSTAVSRPNDPGVKQKVGFIYNTTTVTNVSTKVLLASIHPLYNGGDDSALVGYPSTTDRFYATGRLPFLLTADVVIGGETEPYNFVALHARANGSTAAQNRYDMRKYDVEVLKDSLDAQFSNVNLILLGDYNDDVDETVADIPSTITSYEEYSDDTINYTIVSRALSDGGFRSFVFRENMIDHIAITDELDDNYIDQSVRVHYEFYDNTYTETASDHFPVSASLQMKAFELVGVTATDATCNGVDDGTATITVSGGITPYTYLWSDGQTTATATNLGAGSYDVTATDALGSTQMDMVLIEAPDPIEFVASEDTTVFFGYGPSECTTLEVSSVIGGTAPYFYDWDTGATTASIEVCPEETTSYTVTITDANGCTETATIEVTVIDVTCGNPNNPKVQVCHNGRTICISQNAVQAHLNHGDTLGSCAESNRVFVSNVRVMPNPVRDQLNVRLTSNIPGLVDFKIYNFHGNVVFEAQESLNSGQQIVSYDVSDLNRGFYFLKIIVDGEVQKIRILFKR